MNRYLVWADNQTRDDAEAINEAGARAAAGVWFEKRDFSDWKISEMPEGVIVVENCEGAIEERFTLFVSVHRARAALEAMKA